MDAASFEQVYEAFEEFHSFFAPLFGRRESRGHSQNYVRVLLVQLKELWHNYRRKPWRDRYFVLL